MYRLRRRLIITVILIIASHSLVSSGSSSNDNCWTNEAECMVQATLHKNGNTKETKFIRETLPLEIDCMTSTSANDDAIPTAVTQPPDYLLKRFERAFRVTLNGCRKALKWPTFGFEYLPNCDKIIEMEVTRFFANATYQLHCPSATFIQLEILRFEHNEIATITAEALSNLSLLKELHFKSNALRHIESGAFDNLHFIERIHLESESLLAIKDATLFQRTNVTSLRLSQLKFVTSGLFENLPQTLRELHVEKIAISVGVGTSSVSEQPMNINILSVNNSGLLSNVTIIDCALRIFHLNDENGYVKFLNLSGNSIEVFEFETKESSKGVVKLKTLDLSHNRLNHLPLSWLEMFKQLQQLYLHGNLLKTLPLVPILEKLPAIQNIDLRHNQLESLTGTKPNTFEGDAMYTVVIDIDNNLWNCKWLLAFAHTHPALFRIFHYEKFLSQINVNGLECVPEEPKVTSNQALNTSVLLAQSGIDSLVPNGGDATQNRLNVSTFTLIYGSPYDLKRNQRAEALIIVFMLPVGIAVLFVLLYLWIYCQKVFHLSFYQNCRLCKRRNRFNVSRGNRFDVVRKIPPTTPNTTNTTMTTTTMNNNEDYELPVDGVSPICNCAHSNSNSSISNARLPTLEKCQRTHHITYVPLPDEQPQKIYEEIIDGNDEEINDVVLGVKHNESHVNTIYDHLALEC